jgi:3,4-dihydroxy-9,10-secoandrosta-1,3,5(10)-triene-9,17-dione 4,5-dioxygenase
MGQAEILPISGLGYAEIASPDLASWKRFATDLLGMQVSERGDDVLRLKMEVWVNRLIIRRADRDGIVALGWELRGISDVDHVADVLTKRGYDVQIADREIAEARRVAALATVLDPSGNRLEFFVGARTEEVRQFTSPTGAQFVTGEYGVGHVTIATSRYDEMLDFYTRILGFFVSDFLVGDTLQAAFLGPNGRHHSIALVDTHGTADVYDHLMVEVNELAMVGRAYDRCLELGAPLTYTLGKHWNDHMTSFYVQSPSGFDIEYGWNGRVVDRAAWSAVQGNGEISIWGHHATSADLAKKRGLSSWIGGFSLNG